jgi:hypothetical protein
VGIEELCGDGQRAVGYVDGDFPGGELGGGALLRGGVVEQAALAGVGDG